MQADTKREELKVLGILAIVGVASILLGFITDRSICIFYNVTGVPCPGCGMTRAFIHLFKGDIKGALWFHPLFPIIPCIPFIIKSNKKIYLYGTIVIFIAVWTVRLALLFPHTAPMVYLRPNLISEIKVIIHYIFG